MTFPDTPTVRTALRIAAHPDAYSALPGTRTAAWAVLVEARGGRFDDSRTPPRRPARPAPGSAPRAVPATPPSLAETLDAAGSRVRSIIRAMQLPGAPGTGPCGGDAA